MNPTSSVVNHQTKLSLFPQDLDEYYNKLVQESQTIFQVSDERYENLQKSQKRLYDVQVELSSIAHERHVLESLTKDITRNIEASKAISREDRSRSYMRSSSTTAAAAAAAAETKATEMANLDKPIPIPEYIPPYRRHLKGRMKGTNRENANAMRPHQFGFTPYNVEVKNTADTQLVPSFKQFDRLPSDLANLKMKTVYTGPAAKGKRKKKKKSVSYGDDKDIVNQIFSQRFSRTEQELSKLKHQLAKTNTKFTKEKNKSIEKLRLLVQAMEEKQLWKDQALLESVDQLIEEAIFNFQDVVDETELIAIIEDILTHFPTPNTLDARPSTTLAPIPEEEGDPEEEYDENEERVDNIRYTVVHLPPRGGESREKEDTAVQVELPDEEDHQSLQSKRRAESDQQRQEQEDLQPKEVLPPVVPQIIIQQTLPPSQPTSNDNSEREKDLMELIRTIIATQEKTMQGQQALLLTLVQQQMNAIVPEPPVLSNETDNEESEDSLVPPVKQAETVAIPPPAQETKEKDGSEEMILEENKEFVSENASKRKSRYNTCFGEFLLSGRQLFGKYSVPERLSFQDYLRELDEDEQGSASDRRRQSKPIIEEPRLRRRAAPLTMKLLFPTSNPLRGSISAPKPLATIPPSEITTNTETNFIQFANKLLDTLSDKREKKEDENMKQEITKAVQYGITSGIKQVMGYFPDNNNQEPEEEGKRKRATMEEIWQRKPTKGKVIYRGDDNVDDVLNPKHVAKEIQNSKSSYYQLKTPNQENEDGMNSVEYNDSISLSEEYDAFNDEPYDPSSHKRQNQRQKSSIMSRFLASDSSDEGLDDEEKGEISSSLIVGDKTNQYFQNDIAYDSRGDETITDTEARNDKSFQESGIEEKQQSHSNVVMIPSSALPPLFSSVLEQKQTMRVIHQQSLPSRSKPTASDEEIEEKELSAAARQSDAEDDAFFSLEISEEHREHRRVNSFPSKRKQAQTRYDRTYLEEDDSYPSDKDSDQQFHRDHRTLHQPLPLSPATSSASTSKLQSEDENEDEISIPTANSSSDSFGEVGHLSSPQRYSLTHQTRYTLSEVRMKRKDLLNTWNHRRKKEEKSTLRIDPTSQDRTNAERTVESRNKEEAPIKEGEGTIISISSAENSNADRSYNSMLSSEESSLLSERLKLLRNKNRRYLRKYPTQANTTTKEEEGTEETKQDVKKQSQRPFRLRDNDSLSSNDDLESKTFSVNTVMSDSSGSVAPRITNNRLVNPNSNPAANRGSRGSGGGKGGVNVSIPLLNIDTAQYNQRPRWK